MSSWQTFRLVGLMFLLGGASVASYLFYEHELYFCVFFSCVLALVIMKRLLLVGKRLSSGLRNMIFLRFLKLQKNIM